MDREIPRLAIPVFRSRVAPVLNWCSKIQIFSGSSAEASCGREISLLNMNAFDRLRILQEEGVQTLICGALTPDLLSYGESLGLKIIHGIAGEISDVLKAYHSELLTEARFRLPGCCGARRYRKAWKDGCPVSGGNDCELDSQAVGRIGEAQQGRRDVVTEKERKGRAKSGPGGFCLCPGCGARVRHERGIPCTQIVCPYCDLPMVRE